MGPYYEELVLASPLCHFGIKLKSRRIFRIILDIQAFWNVGLFLRGGNTMKRSTMIELMVLMTISLGFSGCIGHQSFPLAARSGDTISLALGGTLWHETSPGQQITLDDLDITIQQDINGNGVIDADEVFSVKKRYLFRLYPDLTSYVWNFSTPYFGTPVGQSGEWSVVLDLVDASTNSLLPLVGDREAAIVVATNKLHDNYWGGLEGSLSNIPITILSGTGQSNNFNNLGGPLVDMANLRPLPQLAIGFSGSASIAAAALDIDYDETVLKTQSSIKIIQDIAKPNVILNQRIYSDNGNWKMRIFLMSNTGTLAANLLKCFIVWNPTSIATGMTVTSGTFHVTSAKFYNESGAEVVSGITVTTKLLYQ